MLFWQTECLVLELRVVIYGILLVTVGSTRACRFSPTSIGRSSVSQSAVAGIINIQSPSYIIPTRIHHRLLRPQTGFADLRPFIHDGRRCIIFLRYLTISKLLSHFRTSRSNALQAIHGRMSSLACGISTPILIAPMSSVWTFLTDQWTRVQE